ncbi:MAG: NfeD family protein [Merdibacter sp.]
MTTARWGIVKVEGSSWSAASYEGERIEKGSRVKIVAIEGAKLLVAKIEE